MTHVATQGMSDPPTAPGGSDITSWVKTYSLEYSSDGNTYNGYYFNQDLKVSSNVIPLTGNMMITFIEIGMQSSDC